MRTRTSFRAAHAALLAAVLAFLPACFATRAVGLGPDPDPNEPAKGDAPEVIYGKARALFAAKEWDDAADAFGLVWKDHKGSKHAADARFFEAESRYGQGKYNGAFELYKAYLKENPLSSHAATIQRRLYDMGVWTIEEGKHGFLGIFGYAGEGVDMLEYLVNAFPNGDLADDALLYVSDYEWRERRPLDAIGHLHDLVDHYPASEWALEGRLRLAKAYRDLNRGVAYDADALKRSAAQYRAYIDLVTADRNRAREYADLLEQARDELAEVEESLASKGLEAADFYLYDGKVEAARQELRNLVREFPQSLAAAEARERLGAAATQGPAPGGLGPEAPAPDKPTTDGPPQEKPAAPPRVSAPPDEVPPPPEPRDGDGGKK
jgi:outer membrane protein assembly factor BamD (BamD/ComL family)